MPNIRLNKYLANLGIASRRKIDSLIEENKIFVNKKPSYPGQLIDPEKDKILVNEAKPCTIRYEAKLLSFGNGKEVRKTQQLVYIILNKPKGIISTVSDELKRKTVLDLVKIPERVYPVGRLDKDSEGLILLTNDGELANKLTHPKFEIPKTYEVLVRGKISETQFQNLRQGVYLKEGKMNKFFPSEMNKFFSAKIKPDKVSVVKDQGQNTLLEITLHQGINREIRRLLGVLNLEVLNLKRISLGSLLLGNLAPGKWRYLTSEEIFSLKP